MARITIEIGKKGKKKERAISFLICHGNTKKRIPTKIHIIDSDLSSNGKNIKNTTKARMIEEMKRKLEDKLYSLSLDIAGRNDIDATYIAERLISRNNNDLDFFVFAEKWISTAKIKGIKNYSTMLNSLESYASRVMSTVIVFLFSFVLYFRLSSMPRVAAVVHKTDSFETGK